MRSRDRSRPGGTVADLDAARRRRERPTGAARYTFGFCEPSLASDQPGIEDACEPVLVRFARHLEEQGVSAAEQLALFVALPDELWDEAWSDLRRHIDRERAA